MADADDQVLGPAGRHHAFSRRGCQAKRLFTEDLFAGGRGGDHLFFMQPMRRHQNDGVDGGVREYILITAREHNVFRGRKSGAFMCINVDCGHHLDPVAVFKAIDDLFAPPTEADNSGI